jgi:hypothetical protein
MRPNSFKFTLDNNSFQLFTLILNFLSLLKTNTIQKGVLIKET